jgi:hypothetical protein
LLCHLKASAKLSPSKWESLESRAVRGSELMEDLFEYAFLLNLV